ncbi:SDR family oxidoreductase [Hoyosella rhizosphaerae]|uniref:Short-chain dehydrogenase n=1 Tax=Hoyosella rhizosphaerae TaxID=1755582 RepID=A0A916XD70_9ACTN|nr:SDR family oxidoreductase [Hoyosella rhizosphaerae]MBN4927614.1 SDR family oxidoreductase [Hoyosella rhizosphaerae]GGC63080.1 short-chain dehydrogenase [Hoyosella rhizosphaerae]
MSKSVVITGANGGIGLATAIELAQHDFDVIGTVRTETSARAVADAAAEAGVSIRTVLCDVTNPEQTAKAFDEIAGMTGGGPWALVNNAGLAQPGAIEDVTGDLARRQMEVNVLAPAQLMRLVLPAMRERGDGRIINISSMSGRVALPFLGWYAASKYALEAVSDAARREVAGFGIKVVLIEPGSFGTGVWESAFSTLPDRESSAYKDAYALADQIESKSADFPAPTPVAKTIRRALTARHPRSRYLVGADAIGSVLLDAVSPTVMSDYVMRLGAGLAKAPKPLDRIVDQVVKRAL